VGHHVHVEAELPVALRRAQSAAALDPGVAEPDVYAAEVFSCLVYQADHRKLVRCVTGYGNAADLVGHSVGCLDVDVVDHDSGAV
jgi:hypothetical protein